MFFLNHHFHFHLYITTSLCTQRSHFLLSLCTTFFCAKNTSTCTYVTTSFFIQHFQVHFHLYVLYTVVIYWVQRFFHSYVGTITTRKQLFPAVTYWEHLPFHTSVQHHVAPSPFLYLIWYNFPSAHLYLYRLQHTEAASLFCTSLGTTSLQLICISAHTYICTML